MDGLTPAPKGSADATRSWDAHPWLARLVRAAVVTVPLLAGGFAGMGVSRLLPAQPSVGHTIGRTLIVVLAATAVVWLVDRAARRFLPLVALLQLSLIFPDQAPSRLRAALRSGSSRRLQHLVDQARTDGLAPDPGAAARQVVEMIGAIGDHDRRTRGHSERVRLFADLIGEQLDLTPEERQKLQWGALLHDLGKLTVPPEILNKRGRPDAKEWAVLSGHPAAGMSLIGPMEDFLGEWVHAIGGHHEKWDGSGYPQKLAAGEIPRAAMVVAVADSFEVMTAVRSYKSAMPIADARAELTRCAGSHFAPDIVRAFLAISLKDLRLVAGPLAALIHVPFLGNLLRLPASAGNAAAASVGAVSAPAAAALFAAAAATVPPTSDGPVRAAATTELAETAVRDRARETTPAGRATTSLPDLTDAPAPVITETLDGTVDLPDATVDLPDPAVDLPDATTDLLDAARVFDDLAGSARGTAPIVAPVVEAEPVEAVTSALTDRVSSVSLPSIPKVGR